MSAAENDEVDLRAQFGTSDDTLGNEDLSDWILPTSADALRSEYSNDFVLSMNGLVSDNQNDLEWNYPVNNGVTHQISTGSIDIAEIIDISSFEESMELNAESDSRPWLGLPGDNDSRQILASGSSPADMKARTLVTSVHREDNNMTQETPMDEVSGQKRHERLFLI